MAEHGAADWREAFRIAHPRLPDWFDTASVDLSAQLCAVAIPTLLLWGDGDPISPVRVEGRLASLLPAAYLVVLLGGTHDLAIERAEQIAPLIGSHLARTPPANDAIDRKGRRVGCRCGHRPYRRAAGGDPGRHRRSGVLFRCGTESDPAGGGSGDWPLRRLPRRGTGPHADGDPLGFLALCEGFALYAEGAFGIITELYVRPPHRSRELGSALLAAAREHGRRQGWSRLEVTTPPLPAFSRTLGFYEREGFAVSGGRKLRCLIRGDQES